MPPRAEQPRKRPQQNRAKETKARILEVAAQLFGDRGIANTSTNRVAAEAGISIGTLYRYFTDRDEIVKELTDDLFLQVEDKYGRLLTLTGAVKTPRDAFAELIRIGVEILIDNGPLVRALVADLGFLGSGIPEFEPRLRMVIKLYLIQIIGPTRLDVDTMAYIMLNAGFSTALRSVRMEEEGMDREFVIDQTADMIALWVTTLAQAGSHDIAPGPKSADSEADLSSGNGIYLSTW
ncbi:TetR/AcrR family transcriptional regulator [Nocardia fluminea]|uniref:TetR/AcrR family transcriptional regulator n=1 Tax=Nocardia fluminea TaxID=134984 RepID=UPI003657F28D